MPRDKRRQYKGVLGRTLNPRRDTDAKAALAERIDALFKDYMIERSDGRAWERLALALAFDYVGGFHFPSTAGDIRRASGSRSGPKMKLTRARLSRLIEEVERLKAGPPARTAKIACNQLARRGGEFFGFSAKHLEEWYYRHRHRFRNEPNIDWSQCQASPTVPCIKANMELAACLKGCRYPDACPLFAALVASLEKARAVNSAAIEQLARLLIWRAKQDWASPRFELERRTQSKARPSS
jgi:hypothetical protein